MLNAATHYSIDYPDLSLILALVRGGTLARAAALLRVDVGEEVPEALYDAVAEVLNFVYGLKNNPPRAAGLRHSHE